MSRSRETPERRKLRRKAEARAAKAAKAYRRMRPAIDRDGREIAVLQPEHRNRAARRSPTTLTVPSGDGMKRKVTIPFHGRRLARPLVSTPRAARRLRRRQGGAAR